MNFFGVYHSDYSRSGSGIFDAPCITVGRMMLCAHGAVSRGRLLALAWGRARNASALAETLRAAGARQGLELTDGVYVLSCGPAFETPAEIRAYGILGADVVGMSTVPEAMVASACGMRVAGLSFVSNMAAGVTGKLLDGNDVVDCAERHAERLARLVVDFLDLLAADGAAAPAR